LNSIFGVISYRVIRKASYFQYILYINNIRAKLIVQPKGRRKVLLIDVFLRLLFSSATENNKKIKSNIHLYIFFSHLYNRILVSLSGIPEI